MGEANNPPLDLHGTEPDVTPAAPVPPWQEIDLHRAADGTWTLDGVAGLPGPVVAVMVEWGRASRLATFGRVRSVGVHDFGAPVGRRTVVVCEKWAGVRLDGNQPPWDVQGVSLDLIAHLGK